MFACTHSVSPAGRKLTGPDAYASRTTRLGGSAQATPATESASIKHAIAIPAARRSEARMLVIVIPISPNEGVDTADTNVRRSGRVVMETLNYVSDGQR